MKNLSLFGFAAGAMALAFLASAPAGMAQAATPAGYHVAQRVSLPNSGGFDYLGIDAPNRNLYVSAGNQEDVVNADTYKLVGTITGTQGTHGVGISDKDGHGFTSNGRTATSTMFDLKTLKTIKEVKLPIQSPDGIIYDPASDRIFFFNHDSQAAAVDAKTGDVAGTVALPSKAAEFAAADGEGHVFDNLEDSSNEIEIDSHTLKVIHTYPLAPCEGPSGLAMDTAHHRLFVGCHGSTTGNKGPIMAIMDSETGKIVATEPIGTGVDATRFDAGTQLAFASNGGSGDITVIHEDSPDAYTVVGNVPTASGARTMEFDPQTHTLFTVTARFNLPAGFRRGGDNGARRGPAPAPGGDRGPAPAQGAARRGPARGGRFGMIPGSFQLLVVPNH